MRKFLMSWLLLMGLLVVHAGCGNSEPEAKAKRPDPVNVEVRSLSPRTDAGFISAVGRVKNVRESTVSSKVMGKVLSVSVKAGQQVRRGQVLMKIDDRDARARVSQAAGALAQAQAAETIAKQMLDRFERLQESDAASRAKYDKAVFDYRSAQGAVEQASGALKQAKSYQRDTRVLAPFEGTVVDTMIEEGEMASPGYPLLRIEGKSELEFEAVVNGQDVHLIETGHEVVVELDFSRNEKKEVKGTVSEIVPTSDRMTHSNTVRVKLESVDDLRSGTFGRVRFARKEGSCPGILVDQDRLVRHGQLSGVYVVDAGNIVRLRLVRDGRSLGGKTEVLSGLAPGDRIVVSSLDNLQDGAPALITE